MILLSAALAASGHDIPITPPAGPEAPAAPVPAGPSGDPGATVEEKPASEEVVPAAEGTPVPGSGPDALPAAEGAPPEDATAVALRKKHAAELYMSGLAAWQKGRWAQALQLAQEALVEDPELAPARLLAGYALLRLRRFDEATVTLEGLALEPGPSPLPVEKQKEAQRVLRRSLAPFGRNEWAISTGQILYLERFGDQVTPLAGYVFAARAPLFPRVAVRIDGHSPWGGNEDDFDVRGPRIGAYGVYSQPLGPGAWQVDLAAGPVFWAATGRYWADGWEPYVGVRGAAGLDVRAGATVGFRLEVGASAFPTAAQDLSFYASPVDMRLTMDFWLGGPRARPAAVEPG